jgi:hypothetical protein
MKPGRNFGKKNVGKASSEDALKEKQDRFKVALERPA